MSLTPERIDSLLAAVRELESCIVAFSGGVDSAVVAKAARLALGDRALAVTANSASLAAGELQAARQAAEQIGIAHRVLETSEFDNPSYTSNPANRCYFCKTELYSRLDVLLDEAGFAWIANGANSDDAGDFRPGMAAAREHRVRSPLLECGWDKAAVRELARQWGLAVWDKPASPCLSSRVAYGEAVTPERLARIDAAERFLRGCGLSPVRVRYHKDDLARVEVPLEAVSRLAADGLRERVLEELKRLGFRYVTLDLAGFRSGSNNDALPLVSISRLTGGE